MRERLRQVRNSAATVRRHRPDYQIVLYMGLLMLFGLIVMFAIGPQRAHTLNAGGGNFSDSYFFGRQALYVLLSLVAFTLMARVPLEILFKYARRILEIAVGLCLLLAVGGWLGLPFVPEIGGAYRWFSLGPLGSFQPSELLKLGILLYMAAFLGERKKQGKINDVHATLVPVALLTAVVMAIVIILQKDMGTGISVIAIVAGMLMVAGVKSKFGFAAIGAIAAASALLILTSPHRIKRVATFLAGDSITTADAGSYQLAHAKIALGSGGIFGLGVGSSVQATGYLPEVINDAVFAVIGEMFGYIGLMVILAIFAALLFRLLRVADRSPNPVNSLLVIGIFAWFGAHVFINVGSVTGIIPLTGITLPFLSFGGTSMILMASALGLALQASQYTQYESVGEGSKYENSRSGRGLGRTRYAGRSSSI